MSKVFIVNDSGHDMSKAKSFGEFVTLTKGSVNVFRTKEVTEQMKRQMVGIQERDFILLSGAAILNVLAVSVALTNLPKTNVLIFNAMSGEYAPRSIERSILKF